MTESAEQRVVLGWARERLRPLPWRSTRDPWEILVAEVMAQQTGVGRVIPRWEAFLDRWPTPGHLTRTPLAELLEFWSGLGYPRRARSLHLAAATIVERHGGQVPDDLDDLMALPGVGRYTARAVLAFAFERRVGVVDTNVARVLARRVGRRLGSGEAQRIADEAVAPRQPWLWNQAIMEVGAVHCRPVPLCEGCPFAPSCSWAAAGWPVPDPAEASAGVSRTQAPYLGSDRQARGRLLAAVLSRPVEPHELASAAGLAGEPERAQRIAESLVADGLVVLDAEGRLVAPG